MQKYVAGWFRSRLRWGETAVQRKRSRSKECCCIALFIVFRFFARVANRRERFFNVTSLSVFDQRLASGVTCLFTLSTPHFSIIFFIATSLIFCFVLPSLGRIEGRFFRPCFLVLRNTCIVTVQ